MHICLATFNYVSNKGTNGVGIYTQVMARALKERGHEVSVIAIQAQGEKFCGEDAHIHLHSISSGNIHWYISKIPILGQIFTLPVRELEYSYAMWRKVREINRVRKIDLLEGIETGLFFLTIFKQTYPIVIKLHGELYSTNRHIPGLKLSPEEILNRLIQRFAISRATVLVSPSSIYSCDIRQELPFLKKTIYIIENCIDPVMYEEAEKAAVCQKSGDKEKKVLFVGRLERRKGIIPFLKCISRIAESVKDVKFIIAGGYHPHLPKKIIDDIISREGIAKHLNILGAVSREKLIELYRNATVCVVPSYYEVFGLVYLEAMVFKKPVVAFNAGAVKEIIEEGVDGILVEPDNLQGLIDAIIKLLNSPDICKKMGEAGFLRVRNIFMSEPMVNKTIEVYSKAIEQVKGPDRVNLS